MQDTLKILYAHGFGVVKKLVSHRNFVAMPSIGATLMIFRITIPDRADINAAFLINFRVHHTRHRMDTKICAAIAIRMFFTSRSHAGNLFRCVAASGFFGSSIQRLFRISAGRKKAPGERDAGKMSRNFSLM